MVGFGCALTVLNVFTSRRDVALATGPRSEAQHAWLVEAADRPDLAQFFKKLSHEDRVAMAQAVGRYDDAPLAKLSGTLLADFDAEARDALVQALKGIAAVHPEAVAEQLKNKGSFQTLGVSDALRTQGDRVLPAVVAMLANGDARPAAVAYLVRVGQASVAPLLPKLDDENRDVRLAAADALGQLRAREAVALLLKKLDAAPAEDRAPYLAALAAVGDPSTEGLMTSVLGDASRPLVERTPAALGLGRIGGAAAARALWPFASSDDPGLSGAAIAALGVVGPPALADRAAPPLLRLRVASLVEGSKADEAIRQGLRVPATALAAIQAAKGRPSLLPDLAALLPQGKADGDLAAALIAALSATPEGKARLVAYRDDPSYAGFIQRVGNASL